MNFPLTIVIAIGLAMDAFAVSLGVGTARALPDNRSVLRLSSHFGLFQGLMTLVGWLAGSTLSYWISSLDHWVAFVLLTIVGVNMIRAGFQHKSDSYQKNPSKGGMLIVLCVATSIDALAIGLSMGITKTPIVLSALMIGVITFGLSLWGLKIGHTLGDKFGKRMELFGGLILVGIGIRILINHLYSI